MEINDDDRASTQSPSKALQFPLLRYCVRTDLGGCKLVKAGYKSVGVQDISSELPDFHKAYCKNRLN